MQRCTGEIVSHGTRNSLVLDVCRIVEQYAWEGTIWTVINKDICLITRCVSLSTRDSCRLVMTDLIGIQVTVAEFPILQDISNTYTLTTIAKFDTHVICVDPTDISRVFLSNGTQLFSLIISSTESFLDPSISTPVPILLAGTVTQGCVDGQCESSMFGDICSLVCSRDGTHVFAADKKNNCVRCIDLKSRSVTTTVPNILLPQIVLLSKQNDTLIVIYYGYHPRLYLVDGADGHGDVHTLKIQRASEDMYIIDHMTPITGAIATPGGYHLFVTLGHRPAIYVISLATGLVESIAGQEIDFGNTDGSIAKNARLCNPLDLVIAPSPIKGDGSVIYVVDNSFIAGSHQSIRCVSYHPKYN